MAISRAFTTTVSTKGQIVLPKPIRDQRHWGVGVQLIVEETAEGVLLRPRAFFPPTEIDAVVGCLGYEGPPRSVEDMDAGIAAEMKRRHDRR